MQFKVTDHGEISTVPSRCGNQDELREALKTLKKNQSLNVPADYLSESSDKRAVIAMSCIRVGGPGAFKVRKQKDESFEVYRVK